MRNKVYTYSGVFFAFLFMFAFFMPGNAGADICGATPCVESSDIVDGSVTRDDTEPIANVVVVAKSGGDFTSIQDALDAINPTASDPYLVKVMPGTYVEDVDLDSYTHLQGAGSDVTTIQGVRTIYGVIMVRGYNGGTNMSVTGFTIKGGRYGIIGKPYTTVVAMDNIITDNTGAGIYLQTNNSATLRNNVIKNNNGGIILSNCTEALVEGNVIADNAHNGIISHGYSNKIIKNIVSNNGGTGIRSSGRNSTAIIGSNVVVNNSNYGLNIMHGNGQNESSPFSVLIAGNEISGNLYTGALIWVVDDPLLNISFIHNNVVGNNAGDYWDGYDIKVSYNSKPNISFNVYDTINSTSGVGMYNVKSDGTPAPAP